MNDYVLAAYAFGLFCFAGLFFQSYRSYKAVRVRRKK